MIQYITNTDIYKKVIIEKVPYSKKMLWIGTSDIKDMYVHKGKNMVPFLEIMSDLILKGVSIRLIHAKEPGPNFRKDFDKYPILFEGLERMLCPRVHFKIIVIDGLFAYSGSANLTGAGIGAKSERKRNFESGIITDESNLIEDIMNQFDSVWMGSYCKKCSRKEYCSEYNDL